MGMIGIQSYSGRGGDVGRYIFLSWFREDERQGCGSLIGRLRLSLHSVSERNSRKTENDLWNRMELLSILDLRMFE